MPSRVPKRREHRRALHAGMAACGMGGGMSGMPGMGGMAGMGGGRADAPPATPSGGPVPGRTEPPLADYRFAANTPSPEAAGAIPSGRYMNDDVTYSRSKAEGSSLDVRVVERGRLESGQGPAEPSQPRQAEPASPDDRYRLAPPPVAYPCCDSFPRVLAGRSHDGASKETHPGRARS